MLTMQQLSEAIASVLDQTGMYVSIRSTEEFHDHIYSRENFISESRFDLITLQIQIMGTKTIIINNVFTSLRSK